MGIPKFKVFVYVGMIIIAAGANFLSTWKEQLGSYGTVTIAFGIIFFLIGLRIKREQDKKNESNSA